MSSPADLSQNAKNELEDLKRKHIEFCRWYEDKCQSFESHRTCQELRNLDNETRVKDRKDLIARINTLSKIFDEEFDTWDQRMKVVKTSLRSLEDKNDELMQQIQQIKNDMANDKIEIETQLNNIRTAIKE